MPIIALVFIILFRRLQYKPKFNAYIHSFRTVRVNSINSTAPIVNDPLSDVQMKTGCRLGIDSHADTSCVNKHAFVESVVEGITVDAIPFDDSLGKATNLPIVHAIYAVDNKATFRTHLIRICNAIYIPHMEQALVHMQAFHTTF